MRFQPAIGNGPMHRGPILAGISAHALKRVADRADRDAAVGIGFERADDFEQFGQCGFRVREGTMLVEIHF